jgi:undecaprenyl diphosphate synthase
MNKKRSPNHIAIIMDGNRRWAANNKLKAVAGHKKVVTDLMERLIDYAARVGIKQITFWAWNFNNWKRPKPEIEAVMNLFRLALGEYAEKIVKKGARVRIIGDYQKFPNDIREGLDKLIEDSKGNSKIDVTMALNYGGRDELLRAVKKLSEAISNDEFLISNLNEKGFSQFLDTAGLTDPDLIIRTGGNKRLSGFLPWQSEHSELYFTDTLMPDFNEDEFDKAIKDYQERSRRFGGGRFEDYQSK